MVEALIAPAEVRKDMISYYDDGSVRSNGHAGWEIAYGLPKGQKNNEFNSDDFEARFVIGEVGLEPNVELEQTVHSD